MRGSRREVPRPCPRSSSLPGPTRLPGSAWPWRACASPRPKARAPCPCATGRERPRPPYSRHRTRASPDWPITPGPVGRLLGERSAQHLEHLLQSFLPDHVPDADKLGIVRRNAHRQVALVDLEHEVRSFLALDRTDLDLFDPSSPMMGVDDSVADLKRHVACTPSAEPMLPRRTGAISRRWRQTCRSVARFKAFKLIRSGTWPDCRP